MFTLIITLITLKIAEVFNLNTPLVTVFIPIYNSESYIAESLKSIIHQSYKNIEILLVDDGSTDRSVEIINQFKDDRIRLIQNEENMGIPYTRNVGLKEAKGDYIAIMDSDDIADPARIEKQIDFLEENHDIDAVGSYYIQFGGRRKKKVKSKFITPDELRTMLLFYNPIANPSVTMRKKTLDKHNLTYNLNYFVAQDYELWTRLIRVGKVCIIPEYLLYYRFGHENISKKSTRDKLYKRKKLIDDIHKNILTYFGIPLSREELNVFNDFFTETYSGNKVKLEDVKAVIEKLRDWNKATKTFDQQTFSKVLDYCILLGINHQNLSIQHKLNFYRQLVEQKNIIDQSATVIRHFYYKAKKVI